MPTTSEVHEQVTDILEQLVSCRPDQVVPEAVLTTDLGVDSLTVVELGDELGRRYGRYLSDATIDGFVTVQDAIDAIVTPGADAAPVAAATSAAARKTTRSSWRRNSALIRGAVVFAVIGVALGVGFGLGGAAVVDLTGLRSAEMPPLVAPTVTPKPTETTPTPRPTPKAPAAVEPPSLSVDNAQVSPGERFLLSGKFPALGEGAELQVQVKDGDGPWDDFPITTKTRDATGTYRTELYTSRTGKRDFRLLHMASKTPSPTVTVTIG